MDLILLGVIAWCEWRDTRAWKRRQEQLRRREQAMLAVINRR